MHIIIEGVDGSYKSTVANKLSEKFNTPVVKGSSFEITKENDEKLAEHFLSLLNNEEKIIDRFLHSNLVYASLYDGYTMVTEEQQNAIELKIKNKAIVIYLTASIDIIEERLRVRGDDYIKVHEVEGIIKKYNNIMSKAVEAGIKVHTFDTGILSSDEVVKQIDLLLRSQEKTPDVECVKCRGTIKRENSYFNETHCFSCHQEILQELLKNE